MKRISTWFLAALIGLAIAALSFAPRLSSAGPDEATAAAGPKLEFVQAIDTDNQGHPYGMNVTSMALIGDTLYVSYYSCGTLRYYRRDRQTGKLTLGGELDAGQRLRDAFPNSPRWWIWSTSHCITLATARGRLYAIPADGKAMAWYEPDPATGEPIEKGMVECPAGLAVAVSPDGNDLYVKGQPGPHAPGDGRIVWYHLDAATGKPAKSGEISGPAVGNCGGPHMVLSPDGANLYQFATQERKDGSYPDVTLGFKRKPTGEIEIDKDFELNKATPADSHFPSTLTMSPDGKRVYFAAASRTDCWLNIYKRDPATGELSAQETIAGGPRGRHFVFLPDGVSGYWGGADGLAAFKLDPATGHMTEASQLKETASQSPTILALDSANGFLYAGSTDAKAAHSLFVARVEKQPAAK